MSQRQRGRVSAFDGPRGLGEVATDDGRILYFHCAEIADGTRSIEVGAEVDVEVTGGHLGRWEARDIVKR